MSAQQAEGHREFGSECGTCERLAGLRGDDQRGQWLLEPGGRGLCGGGQLTFKAIEAE